MHSTWLIHLSNGPYWNKIIGTEYTNCRKNWWANLLYINNYIDNENMCMQQTWYLASDTQLFLVSLIVLSLIWKFQRYAKIILGINLIIGMMIPGIVSYVVQSDIVIRQFPEPLYHLLLKIPHWHLLYASGYSNLGGYAIGLCCGYIYYKNLNAKINVKKIHVVLWWILSFGLCIFIILIAGIMYKEDFTYSRLGAAFYWSVGKNLFALGVAIGIYGTTLNIGWFAKWILELPNVQILGRLTYSTYIVHVALAKFRAGTIRSPLFISDYYFFFTAMSDILISYLVGTMLCIAFEMPISALQKIFVPQLSKRKEEDSSEKSLKTVDFSEEEMQTRI
ncbi:O-acyltransferase like protein [Aethina tumida]|uniref:O-acyltransferase like protein n=1 Tax=Aethina tumida TaxID=116153 RepID=UPI002148147B|nr:O-acyltransferase like protein [Aethina tumida]